MTDTHGRVYITPVMNTTTRTNTEIFTALREARGFTKADLARAVGITEEQLRNIERGRNLPRLQTAQRIAQELRAPIDRLWPSEAA